MSFFLVPRLRRFLFAATISALSLSPNSAPAQSTGHLGIFEGHTDIGTVTPPGTVAYNSHTGVYTINAAGWDLWAANDGFHYAWKKLSSDLSLSADIDFPVKTGNHHHFRKAVLMIRQSLDADSAYVDVAQHGDGMVALQYRRAKGADTQDIELNTAQPRRVRLEKRGNVFTLFLSTHGEPLHQAGASISLPLGAPFYVGIGVSAHNAKVPEKATFANLEIKPLAPPDAPAQKVLYSTVQVIKVAEREATVINSQAAHAQAPNWSRDGKTIVFNQDGHMYSAPATGGGTPQLIDTGSATSCSGSHGFSPDGKWLAITCASPGHTERRVSIIPATGGEPRILTQTTGYFHSWSPDGKTILFTRGGPQRGMGNIYSISVDGGPETALTTGTGLSDDPDFSPDGKWVYFNTDRWGGMQIGRMHPDGSAVEQVTFDQFKNWTPHPSPDGKMIVFISYPPDVTTHAANKDITLRILSTTDKSIRNLVNLVGGDGSMNVANWSPDSKSCAFVSYQMLPASDTGATE
jgi:Tol biopolymer transport system component